MNCTNLMGLRKGKGIIRAFLVAQTVTNLPAMWESQVWSLGWEDPLEKAMATHSSILVWRIPQTEEHGGLQSMGSQRVRNNWATYHFTPQIMCIVDPWTMLVWIAQVHLYTDTLPMAGWIQGWGGNTDMGGARLTVSYIWINPYNNPHTCSRVNYVLTILVTVQMSQLSWNIEKWQWARLQPFSALTLLSAL